MKERNFSILKHERFMYERYDKAVEEGDQKTLDWFAQFGTPQWEHQMISNACQYEKYLGCGYSQKPILNEHGWIVNGSCKDFEEKAELVSVFADGGLYAEIRILQHPNGKWVASLNYNLARCGGGSYPSIWNDQHPSRTNALNAALDSLIHYIEDSGMVGDRKYLPIVKKMRGCTIQLTLF